MRKYLFLIIFIFPSLCYAQILASKLKLEVGFARTHSLSGGDKVIYDKHLFAHRSEEYFKAEIALEYEFLENITFRAGYTFRPYSYYYVKTPAFQDTKYTIGEGSSSSIGYHQVPFSLILDKPLYKGFRVGTLLGGVVNHASSNMFKNTELIRGEVSPDSVLIVRQTLLAKRNFLLPQLGVRFQYQFKRGIELNYLITYTYGRNIDSFQVDLNQEIGGEESLVSSVFIGNNELWNRFTLSIPIYNFDRNRKEKIIE